MRASRKGQAITQGYTNMPTINSLDGLRAAHAASPAGRVSLTTAWERFTVQVALLTPHDTMHGDRVAWVELRITMLKHTGRVFHVSDANRLARQIGLALRTSWVHEGIQFTASGVWADESAVAS